VLRIVQAVVGRSTYLTLLRENPGARAQLSRLCAASPWLSAFITASPMLLDALLDARALYAPPERAELAADLAARFAAHPVGETDAGMDLLRRFQKEMTLRVAAADLAGALPLVKVSDRLTWLAEVIIAQALHEARREMRALYGEPCNAAGAPAGFAVIAYGKFGGLEMSYGSDLDVVFLHDCADLLADTVGGGRAIATETWLSRLAQRVISWLSTQTAAGRAYEVDIELRPDGRRGMMVASLAGFGEYQRENAWTWEHQALTRARFVAGDAAIGAAFEDVRRAVLRTPREAAKLRQDIADMRRRMRAHLDREVAGRWDVKQGVGGVIDVEFITQYLVLRDAPRDAGIVRYSDNWRQLEALERAGSLSAAERDALIAVYRSYRALLHRRALEDEDALIDDSQLRGERETIRALWQEFLGG
jgi:glutamate-ammonia-ligase adenylyltransferase